MKKNHLSGFFTCLIFLALLSLSWNLKAQQAILFTGDSTAFPAEIEKYFQNITENERKIVTPVFTELFALWQKDYFSHQKKKIIYAIGNEMARRKIRPYPDFFSYFLALNSFVKSNQPESHFIPWSEILLKLLTEKNSRRFLSFLEFSNIFFPDQLLYKSPSTKWKIESSGYTMKFDSVPVITFPTSTLVCYSSDDSLTINQTRGEYFPLRTAWQGRGGHVDWRRAGARPEEIFADLAGYNVQLRFAKFEADSVMLTHKKYFSRPVPGRYIDKVVVEANEDRISYPRFYSYDKMIGIRNLFANIDFLGGFAMEGSKIIGSGGKSQDARLFFKKDGQDFIVAGSGNFVIRGDRISSALATVTIYHDDDSIFHPGLQLKYLDDLKELSFSKDERLTRISPWYDSYHQIDIYCEALYWKIGDPRVSFQMMKGPTTEGKAVFESGSYYSLPRYEKLQGIDENNPLLRIKSYTEKTKSREFYLDDFTRFLRIPSEQVENLLLNMAVMGYLVYDQEDKKVMVKDKLYDYINAYHGKSDYDGIFFSSLVSGTANGMLNLETFDLVIKGVEVVVLSDSQVVQVYPSNKEITLKKNRDFLFSGKVEGGIFDFYVKDCSFEYGKFRINMPVIDSMQFYTFGKKVDPKTGRYPMNKVKTSISNLSGTLLIDDPNNKSGLKKFPQYPVFTNNNTAFVYWEKPHIHKGVYKKENFFYEVDPFTISRIDDLDPDSLRFKGNLTSAGIFPVIREPLKVRPDNSLGIEKVTGSDGLPVYGGKGTYFSSIDLSNRGLRGKGLLKCLDAESASEDFLFLPDSMTTIAKSFALAERSMPTELPSAHGDSVSEFWLPFKDSLVVKTIGKSMSMYADQSQFQGTLALTPTHLTGDGTVKIMDAVMDSRGFQFYRNTFDALIANFRIKSYDLADLTISTKNYRTHFDFTNRRGEFKSNVGISKVEFPINQYTCSMDRFDWLIDSEEIQLYNEETQAKSLDTLNLAEMIDVGYTGSEFISVHPQQDSLKFFAVRARYNLRTNIIKAEDVRIIKVADAAIYPDSGKVVIQKEARMNTLERAIVIANTETRHHQFYNANISIGSRKNYTGTGDYNYRDREGGIQKIQFDKIRVDSGLNTVASGKIPDTMQFFLSPEFAFRGDFTLHAPERKLHFDGGFYAVTTCFSDQPQWIRFESDIDPDHVMIPLNKPLRNIYREPVNLGIMFYNKESRINSSFFRPQVSFSDTVMSTATGSIEYNAPTNEFRIASADKLADISKFGPSLSLNTWNCKMRGEGKLNLSLNSGPLKLETYGIIDYFIIPDSTRINCALTLNFPFSEQGLQRFTDQLNAVNLSGISLLGTQYKTALGYMTSSEEFGKLKTDLEMLGKFRKFPDELERTLFLTDVTLHWDSSSKSYISSGNIGIASVGKNQVNRYVRGIIELSQKRTGDDFTVYLELTPDNWYYFNYRNNVLRALSSDLNFNDIVREATQSKAEMKRVSNISKNYSYAPGTVQAKRAFMRKFENSETQDSD